MLEMFSRVRAFLECLGSGCRVLWRVAEKKERGGKPPLFFSLRNDRLLRGGLMLSEICAL